MPLADFQGSLGRMVRASNLIRPSSPSLTEAERRSLTALTSSAGFQFTVKVQRSWCTGRTSKAAHLTLSVLSEERRQQLLDAWVSTGGGTTSFVGAEAGGFLSFASARLPALSPEWSVCHFEMAALRVAEGLVHFRPPDLSAFNSQTKIRRGRYASLVKFQGDPNAILDAMMRHQAPVLSPNETSLLFAPGLSGLSRPASLGECALFERLENPSTVGSLKVADWLRVGLLELA